MNSTDQKFESVLASLGLPGPRVTLAMVEEVLATVTYDTRVIPGTTCTQATAILPTGFVVGRGEAACADPANFNPALGIERAISKARDNARDEIWKLEGYRLSQALHEVRQGVASSALRQIRSVLSVKGLPGLPERLVGPAQEKACQASAEGYTPHQVRVIHEKAELDDKAASLARFFESKVFVALADDERDRLRAQWSAMGVYSSILGDRIAAMRPGPAPYWHAPADASPGKPALLEPGQLVTVDDVPLQTVEEWASTHRHMSPGPAPAPTVGGVEVVASVAVPPGAAYLTAGDREVVKIRTGSQDAGAAE